MSILNCSNTTDRCSICGLTPCIERRVDPYYTVKRRYTDTTSQYSPQTQTIQFDRPSTRHSVEKSTPPVIVNYNLPPPQSEEKKRDPIDTLIFLNPYLYRRPAFDPTALFSPPFLGGFNCDYDDPPTRITKMKKRGNVKEWTETDGLKRYKYIDDGKNVKKFIYE